MSTKSIYQFHITWAITAALPFVLMYGGNVALADDKEPCVFVLDNQEDYDKKMEDCFKASGLGNYTEIGEAVEKANGSMDKFDFDDKCFYQCIYKGYDMINDDATMKKDKVKTFFKGNFTTEIIDAMAPIWDKCIDDAAKMGKEKGFTPCKIYALHNFCFFNVLETDKQFAEVQKKC